jgi:NAD(P)-dependent dehydrogenase (short-subunit alcohol dehydrogenase family)
MPTPPFDLTGRTAIITGGGTGIGRATAIVFAKVGADVILASRRLENLERVAAEVRALGRRAIPVQTDVHVEADVERMAERARQELGRIDILVNNAGGSYRMPAEEVTPQLFDRMVSLNLRGPYLCARAIYPLMRQQGGGVIVNIASGAGTHGAWGVMPYAAAKAGLIQMTKVLAGEWGKDKIRVNCIAVGAIKTEGFLRAMDKAGKEPDELAGRNAMRRGGWPEEIAYPILFLASDASSYMSGETFGVNGGPLLAG